MRRLVNLLVVALLTFSVSGVYGLTIVEPCTGLEDTAEAGEDASCPPTCVTCGCCAQAVEAVSLHVASTLEVPNTPVSTAAAAATDAQPRDILHVPKRGLS